MKECMKGLTTMHPAMHYLVHQRNEWQFGEMSDELGKWIVPLQVPLLIKYVNFTQEKKESYLTFKI